MKNILMFVNRSSEITIFSLALDIASTQELLNDFLQNEIEYSSRLGPFSSAKLLEEVIEEPCIKRSASLVHVSECESESDNASQKSRIQILLYLKLRAWTHYLQIQ